MLIPNIDRKGRIARATGGSLLLLAAAAIFLISSRPFSAAAWSAVIALAAAGLLGLFQASLGWCAARACGIKTPL